MTLEKWTRREFVRSAAGVVALPQLMPQMSPDGFAYVASGTDSIHAFRVQREQWTPIQQIACAAPGWIIVTGDTLFAANDVGMYEQLPRGSITSFRIGPDGRLALLGRTALSLAATHPRHMAISPDGKLLAVAAYEGGIYNLFSMSADGVLGAPSGIFKDTGCAHPHRLLFDNSGKHLIASDVGSNRLSVFGVQDGRLTRLMQRPLGDAEHPAPAPAGDSTSIVDNTIYYRSVKVAVVPAAKSVALRT